MKGSTAAAQSCFGNKTIHQKVGHIVEDPGGISRLIDVEVPTEYYYEEYAKDLKRRHPKASPDVLEHAVSLNRIS